MYSSRVYYNIIYIYTVYIAYMIRRSESGHFVPVNRVVVEEPLDLTS